MSTATLAPDYFHRQLDRFDTSLKPDWTVTIKQLYNCGRTIPEIVKALYDAPGVNLGAVMDALGFDYFCEVCGRGVDLNAGETCWAADGDRDYPFWGVAPHGSFGFECSGGGAFVTRGNSPYIGESPMRERAE